jgi:hypothetical protein
VAIVKANFTKSKGGIKAALRYMAHRPDREGERITRDLFGHDGGRRKADFYQMIDAHKGITYFRFVLNFDPKREDKRRDLDLRAITRQTIRALEDRLQRQIDFIAVEHNNHGKNKLRHIHAILPIKLVRGERLISADFKFLRDYATQKALLQRKARDLVQQYFQKREYLTRSRASVTPAPRPIDMTADRARRIKQPSPVLYPCPTSGLGHAMVKLPNGKYWCRECERVHEQSVELSL